MAELGRRRGVWLAVVLPFLLVACSSSGASGTPAGSKSLPALPDPSSTGAPLPDSVTANRTYKLGFSFPEITIPFFVTVSYGAAQECKRLKVECRFTFGGGYDKPEVQVHDLQTLGGLGLDGLTMIPADDQADKPVLQGLLDKGIVVSTWSFDIGSTGLKYYGFNGSSHKDMGNAIATTVTNCIKAKGKTGGTLIDLGGPKGAGNSIQIEQGYKDVLGASGNSGFKVVFQQFTNESREDGIRVMQDALTANPNPDGILAEAPELGQAAIQVLKARGKKPGEICLSTAGGYDTASAQAVKDGWYDSESLQQAVVTGQQAIRKLVAILNGQQVPYEIHEPLLTMTKDNVNSLDLSTIAPAEGWTPVAKVP